MSVAAPPRLASVADLIGRPACDGGGVLLGRVEDVVVDLDADRLAYALLSFGGFVRADRLFAMPVRLLSLGDGETVTVRVDRTMLKNAPAFPPERRAVLSDRRWGLKVYSYFGYTPYWE